MTTSQEAANLETAGVLTAAATRYASAEISAADFAQHLVDCLSDDVVFRSTYTPTWEPLRPLFGSRVPGVQVLATSREVLDLPAGGAGGRAVRARAAGFSGLAAVRGSGRCVRCEYRRGCLGTGVCAEICRLVDGMPLAIELAAARLRSMSVDELAGHLREQFSVLSGGRGRHARHRTQGAGDLAVESPVVEPVDVGGRRELQRPRGPTRGRLA